MAAESTRWRPDWAVPPGEVLQETLEERGLSQSELARRMARPVKTINEIVNGKAILTPETAIQLELTLGIDAGFWNGLEKLYREQLARAEKDVELAEWSDWAKTFPIADLERHELIGVGGDEAAKVGELLTYFAVGSPKAWESLWAAPTASYRASQAFEQSRFAVASWLRWGELAAERIETKPFDANGFMEVLREARGFTRRNAALIAARLTDLCAAAGVAFVITPELGATRLSGAAHWSTAKKAVLQLSGRYWTDDHFWFSFFHEAAHLLEGRRISYVDGADFEAGHDDAHAEAAADQFARDLLLPPEAYEQFVKTGAFTAGAVREFAGNQGIAPGIVVGRLQFDKYIGHSRLNSLKRPIRPA